MRKLFTLLIFFLSVHQIQAQDIAAIQNADEINPFLSSHFSNETIETFGYHNTSEAHSSQWFKTDINMDGQLDLLVNGKISAAFIIKNDGVKFIPLFRFVPLDGEYWFTSIDTTTSNTIIRITPRSKAIQHYGSDTISVVYDDFGFIEHNKNSTDKAFKAFKMKVLPCFGSCETFIFSISEDGSVVNKSLDGDEINRIKIPSNEANNFFEILNTLSLNSITQPVLPSDQRLAKVTLTYSNGNTYKFEDYGLGGSFTLRNLYNRVNYIRNEYGLQK